MSSSSVAAHAAAAASSYAAQLGVIQPLPSLRTQIGPYLWRANFDSANMERVEWAGEHTPADTFSAAHMSTPDTFDCWLSSDPMSNYRVFFHVAVSGGRKGKSIRLRIRNLNNKKPLYGEGMRPLVRTTSHPQWRRVSGVEFRTFQSEEGGVRSFLTQAEGEGAEGGEDGEGEGEGEGGEGEQDEAAAAATAPSSSVSSSSAKMKTSSAKKKIKHDTMELTLLHTFDSDQEAAEGGEGDETFFAFCLPYSYTELQEQLRIYERRFSHPNSSHSHSPKSPSQVYFHRELLTHTLEGRRIDLLTISDSEGLLDEVEEEVASSAHPLLFPRPTHDSKKDAEHERMFAPREPPAGGAASSASAVVTGSSSSSSSFAPPAPLPSTLPPPPVEPRARRFAFAPSSSSSSSSSGGGKPKRLVFLSARVHPGETPSSWMLAGALDFVLDHHAGDPRAAAFRRRFVLKVVPMLNPDGVVHGWYRTDSLGQNLNRCYADPSWATSPAIKAVRTMMAQWGQREGSSTPAQGPPLFAYIDLHAHAMKRGCFVFGNHLDNLAAHHRSVSFARLVSLNCPWITLDNCMFSAAGMKGRDQRDGLSKEGSGRVALFKLTECVHCYTVEVNYHAGRTCTVVDPLPEQPREGRGEKDAASSSSAAAAPASASAAAASASSSSSVDLSWQRDDYLLSQSSRVGPPLQYGETHFRAMGKALMVSLLDLLPPDETDGLPANPYSRLPSSELRDLAGAGRWAQQFCMRPPRKLTRKLGTKRGAAKGDAAKADK